VPIKPENKARYPANWKEIRAAILARAGHRCEKCGVHNGSRIVRGKGSDDATYMIADGRVFCAETGKYLGRPRMSDYECTGDGVDIVLTIAHLDHVPENCEPENLRAWCQRCHLRYDAAHHAETARATRHARKAIADMFDTANQQANTEKL
jgi:5-methylcytosine-specific restriction endonuclease McrA